MGVEANQDALCSIKKILRCSVRTSCRCASEHRALFSLVLLLYLLYKSSQGFFTFLLSSSPVIICTTLLLGVLLSYGSTHLPEIDEDRKAPADISAPKFGCSSRNVRLKAYKGSSVPAVKESIIKEASFGRRDSNERIDLDESVPFLKVGYQGDERFDAAGGRLEKMLTCVPFLKTLQQVVGIEEYMKAHAEKESKDAFSSKDKGDEYANLFEEVHQSRVDEKETTFGLHSSSVNVREDIGMVAKPNHQGRVFTDSQSGEVADVSEHKAVDGATGKCRWGRAFSVRQRKKLADIKIEASNSVVDNQLDYSLCSPFTRVGSHDCSSGFDPDNAERWSPDVSMTDTAPVLDETAPLLGADFSCPDHVNNGDSDKHSSISSKNSQAESDSNDVASNSKAKDDAEEKDAGNEPAFLWTADDEKNAMDLGYSEMERNRRLEILMAKRKSRKHIRFELDGSDVGGIADDLSSFRPQVIYSYAQSPSHCCV
ncbi:uncharacterized protein LOC133929115 [Phragmites australis]|uniref:uncharacterized protein LOC133929115 n=1 Tax=Phragmites australis TaxID=29695 RepID=UPI002D787F98|nr:uncharacterized protein LOC133929115 [Phragmites australis]XP_062231717.1 uncharacterized protein LOC133929115 [Phragmites australis]